MYRPAPWRTRPAPPTPDAPTGDTVKPTPTAPAMWLAPCRHLVYEMRPRRDTPTGSTSQVTEDVCRNCGAVLRTIINSPGRAVTVPDSGNPYRRYETTCKDCGKLLVEHRVTPYDFGRRTP